MPIELYEKDLLISCEERIFSAFGCDSFMNLSQKCHQPTTAHKYYPTTGNPEQSEHVIVVSTK